MNLSKFHLKNGFPNILPIIDSYEHAVLVGLEMIYDNSKYKIIFYKVLTANHKVEIHTCFIEHKHATHYFINNLSNINDLNKYIELLAYEKDFKDGILEV